MKSEQIQLFEMHSYEYLKLKKDLLKIQRGAFARISELKKDNDFLMEQLEKLTDCLQGRD